MSKYYMIIAVFIQLSSSLEKFLDMMEKKEKKKKNEISSCVIPYMHQ